jgi:hypothetical protein
VRRGARRPRARRFALIPSRYAALMHVDWRSERGAIGWLLVGIVVGVILVLWLIVQGFQLIF